MKTHDPWHEAGWKAHCRIFAQHINDGTPPPFRSIEAGKDYVRDVSFPVGSQDRAAGWVQEEGIPKTIHRANATRANGLLANNPDHRRTPRHDEGRDWICTGTFDGFTCGSDADSGL